MAAEPLPETLALFPELDAPACQPLVPGAVRFAGLAETAAPALWRDVQAVLAQAPLRHLVTPGGFSIVKSGPRKP